MSDKSDIARFPCARIQPPRTPGGTRDLGTGKFARALGVDERYLSGHWCSRCGGVWYGLLLEVECPVCGNRGG